MKKAKSATKSFFKRVSGRTPVRGSLPIPQATPERHLESDAAGTASFATQGDAPGLVAEASVDQAEPLTISQTTQSDTTDTQEPTPPETPIVTRGVTPQSIVSATPESGHPFAAPRLDPIPMPMQTAMTGDDFGVPSLDSILQTFEKNYKLFAAKNSKFLVIGEEFQTVFVNSRPTNDIKRSAQIFGDGIRSTLQTMERKNSTAISKWASKVGNFLAKLYPVVRLSLNLTVAASDVPPLVNTLSLCFPLPPVLIPGCNFCTPQRRGGRTGDYSSSTNRAGGR
jgi:hypothetical protein